MPEKSPELQRAKLSARAELALVGQELLAETFPRANAAGTSGTALTSQQIEYGLIGLRSDDVVTNIILVTSASGASGASGTGTVGLYDKDGKQLAVSADATVTYFEAAPGVQKIPLTSAYTTTYHGAYYVAVLTTYVTTQPSLLVGASNANASKLIGSGVRPFAQEAASTSLPATATFANGTNAFWFGVS